MKVLIFGEKKSEAEALLKRYGFEVVSEQPDFVASYGGDGTLMRAEYSFPDIPKIILKASQICKRCFNLSNEEILEKIRVGNYKIEEFHKLKAQNRGKTFYSINDVVIHNKDPRHAIRYRLWLDEKGIGGEVIGDGVIISTPFGSTGYYRSITDSFFEAGIGIAFNNSTEQADHMVVNEDRKIRIKIVRGPAWVFADNQEGGIEIDDGDEVLVEKSGKTAKIVEI